MVDYKLIEDLLVQLLSLLVDVFSDTEINEVKEFIGVGEYGLAFDTLIDIIDEESKAIPHRVLELAKQVAVSMDLDSSNVEARLSDLVISNSLY